MKIEIPSIQEQQKIIFEKATLAAIEQLQRNLEAPVVEPQNTVDESLFSRAHLLDEKRFEPPPAEIVRAYFEHFQSHFPDYDTDKKLADLLGVSGNRRIREYKSGARRVQFEVWRKFLIITGRVPQDVLPVLAYMS